MSYDLLVFEPKSAPRDEDSFFEWLEEEDVDVPSDDDGVAFDRNDLNKMRR